MFSANRDLARLAAEIASANGWTEADTGTPVDEAGILAWEAGEPVERRTHGTARELVMDQIRAGAAESVPQGLLDRAGLTRDGADAAEYHLGRQLEAAGVPEEFREAPADLTRNDQLSLANPRGLWLSGDVGRAKTTTACAVLKGWLMAHPDASAVFATEADLLGSMKRAFDAPAMDAEVVLGRYVKADLLVLDDMGKTRLSGWGVSQVFRVVDGRWAAHRPTIYTSQHDLPAWGSLMEAGSAPTAKAMVSRISGSCDQIMFGGRDMRLL